MWMQLLYLNIQYGNVCVGVTKTFCVLQTGSRGETMHLIYREKGKRKTKPQNRPCSNGMRIFEQGIITLEQSSFFPPLIHSCSTILEGSWSLCCLPERCKQSIRRMSWVKGLGWVFGSCKGSVSCPKMPLVYAVLPMALIRTMPLSVEPTLCKADSQVPNRFIFFFFPRTLHIQTRFNFWCMHSTPSFLGVGLLVYSCIVTVFNTVLKTISKHLLKLPYHLLFQSKPPLKRLVVPEFWMYHSGEIPTSTFSVWQEKYSLNCLVWWKLPHPFSSLLKPVSGKEQTLSWGLRFGAATGLLVWNGFSLMQL